MEFRWNPWNLEHIAGHGVSPEEAEQVVLRAERPYPQARADGKWCVVGRGHGGRWLQVIYVFDAAHAVFIIHARPLTDREKRRERKRTP